MKKWVSWRLVYFLLNVAFVKGSSNESYAFLMASVVSTSFDPTLCASMVNSVDVVGFFGFGNCSVQFSFLPFPVSQGLLDCIV